MAPLPSPPQGMLAIGLWPPAQVTVSEVPEPVRPPAWHAEVDRDWQELIAREPHLYDGPVATLVGYSATPELFHLELGRSSFRYMATTHARPAHFEATYGPRALAMGLAACIALALPSGGLLFGRRSRHVHRGVGKWHPVAGHVDPTRHPGPAGAPCPFATVRGELAEELGLAESELEGLVVIGLQLHSDLRKPEVHVAGRTRVPLDEVRERQRVADDAHELDALIEIGAGDVPDFLAGRLGPITEVARATVQIHQALGLFPRSPER